jgi:hypothetical protein
MLPVVENHVRRLDAARGVGWALAGIQVTVKVREIATGDFQAQLVSLQKDVRGSPEVNAELLSLPRVHELDCLLRIPVTGPQNSLREVLRESVRPNVD